MEDQRIAADQLPAADKENVSRILERIVADGKTYNDYLINDKHQNIKITERCSFSSPRESDNN